MLLVWSYDEQVGTYPAGVKYLTNLGVTMSFTKASEVMSLEQKSDLYNLLQDWNHQRDTRTTMFIKFHHMMIPWEWMISFAIEQGLWSSTLEAFKMYSEVDDDVGVTLDWEEITGAVMREEVESTDDVNEIGSTEGNEVSEVDDVRENINEG